jgi:hypothetical protein
MAGLLPTRAPRFLRPATVDRSNSRAAKRWLHGDASARASEGGSKVPPHGPSSRSEGGPCHFVGAAIGLHSLYPPTRECHLFAVAAERADHQIDGWLPPPADLGNLMASLGLVYGEFFRVFALN